METIFKKGMTVYDQIFFPDVDGRIIEIHYESNKILLEVKFFSKYRLDPLCTQSSVYYTEKGYMIGHFGCDCKTPTLSTKPYKVDLQGFEQKVPAPTYEEALKEAHKKDKYYYLPNDLEAPSEELTNATVALLKLLFLRDYYNEGWHPDWSDNDTIKFTIFVNFKDLSCDVNYSINRILAFKSKEIRDKFFKEQKELLEIAKPLL